MEKDGIKIENEEQEVVYTEIIRKIINISKEVGSLDEYFSELPTLQSKIDEEISDLLHYIENNDLNSEQSTKMIKLLKEKRLQRRSLLNDNEIKNVYNTNKNRLVSGEYRAFFEQSIHKKAKELNSKYKNRQISEEDIEELINKED